MLTFLVLLYSLAAVQSAMLHDYMTDAEIAEIFHVQRSKVPSYRVTSTRTWFQRRNEEADKIAMRTTGEHIDAYLNPTDGFFSGIETPVFLAKANKTLPSGVEYVPVKQALKNFVPHPNPDDSLVLIINQKTSRRSGARKNLQVRPVPKRLEPVTAGLLGLLFGHPRNQILRLGSSYGNDTINDYSDIVYRAASLKVNGSQTSRVSNSFQKNSAASQERNLPAVIYPEILVVMDHRLFATQDKNVKKAVLYLLSFWNAVDLRYRSMTNPKIRLNIAGIVIAEDEGGNPYLDNNRVREPMANYMVRIDADKALKSGGQHFYYGNNLPNHDVVVIMTGADICNMAISAWGTKYCDSSARGYANDLGACNTSSVLQMTQALGLVEDNGGYSGILPATHELAHLLGVPHDEGECEEGRFIMSPSLHYNESSFLWSNCSKESFRKFLSSDNAECLRNEPPKQKKNIRLLPGRVESLHEQCAKYAGTTNVTACEDRSPCIILQCRVQGERDCLGSAAAAEGSICAPGKSCISGYCVALEL
ncbi:A disintegrin and metalloproteinase with thrombospondin motifs like [Diachasmimorpha longicaudata]|uniref:A disintegrin and metalloproteinase with thrombospondin motifs like n=1 Tax=Diachasmimorpha longicaudata TaxID=58733 RepID=UPI0030B8865D